MTSNRYFRGTTRRDTDESRNTRQTENRNRVDTGSGYNPVPRDRAAQYANDIHKLFSRLSRDSSISKAFDIIQKEKNYLIMHGNIRGKHQESYNILDRLQDAILNENQADIADIVASVKIASRTSSTVRSSLDSIIGNMQQYNNKTQNRDTRRTSRRNNERQDHNGQTSFQRFQEPHDLGNRHILEAIEKIEQSFLMPSSHSISENTEGTELPQSSDSPQYLGPARDRFGNQALPDIFPKVNLDHITDAAEKNAYQAVLYRYAQVLHDKATQAYPEIFQHYQDSQIYYKWYGASKELKQMVAFCDEHDEKFSVGPSKGIFLSRFGMDVNQYPNLYKNKNMQDVLKHLQSNKQVQWAMYDILKPIYKQQEKYTNKKDSNTIKTGPIGLYLTDNYIKLTQEFGGNGSTLSTLYYDTTSRQTSGPWTLPDGAAPEQSQVYRIRKQKYGDVLKFDE